MILYNPIQTMNKFGFELTFIGRTYGILGVPPQLNIQIFNKKLILYLVNSKDLDKFARGRKIQGKYFVTFNENSNRFIGNQHGDQIFEQTYEEVK